MKKSTFIALGLLATFLSVAKAQDARQILDASGVKGGLVVAIGCDSPALLAQLRAGDSYLVHGLDRDPGKIAAARTYLAERGLYGSITAARWEGARLPYVDDVVNLIVVTGDAGHIPRDELTRVLAPLGVIADARNENIEITRKTWPAELDEWSHYLYDASNNAVSRDTVVAPPRGLRWTCGPEYGRSHEHFASMSAMVTAGGRIFYIIDEGPISSVFLPPVWKAATRVGRWSVTYCLPDACWYSTAGSSSTDTGVWATVRVMDTSARTSPRTTSCSRRFWNPTRRPQDGGTRNAGPSGPPNCPSWPGQSCSPATPCWSQVARR